MRLFVAALTTFFALGAGAASAWAQIEGRVLLDGKAPSVRPIDVSADPACRRLRPGPTMDRAVVRKDGVADAFVYLLDPPEMPHRVWSTAELNLVRCNFSPRVFGLLAGQKLRVTNRDPTLHTVHVKAAEDGFLKSLPRRGQSVERRMRHPQVMVPIESRSHPWMRAYMGVLAHPYFGVTNRDGVFSLPTKGLPDGTYQLRLWHPELGEKTARVRVQQGNGRVVLTLQGAS